jgi:predicted Rossmann-fold nucleotide-binding protein
VLVSDAFIVVPGGIGTVLETMLVWQLLQVNQLHNTPLILVGKMWCGLVDWCRQSMLRKDFELASPEDMDIPTCVEDGESILRIIRAHHAKWKKAQGRSGQK